MSAPSRRARLWWDRELDYTGRPIRADVRKAGHEVWGQACDRANAVLGDTGDAAELMERSVSRVSRYLDGIGSALFAESTNGLLISAFCRALRRYALKLRRLELVGGVSELSETLSSRTCSSKEVYPLDAQMVARRLLTARGRRLLALRTAGFEWKEIAELLRTTEGAARAEFSRELKRARLRVRGR
jgi:hypothetical protein